jgi:hypothetical protein
MMVTAYQIAHLHNPEDLNRMLIVFWDCIMTTSHSVAVLLLCAFLRSLVAILLSMSCTGLQRKSSVTDKACHFSCY